MKKMILIIGMMMIFLSCEKQHVLTDEEQIECYNFYAHDMANNLDLFKGGFITEEEFRIKNNETLNEYKECLELGRNNK